MVKEFGLLFFWGSWWLCAKKKSHAEEKKHWNVAPKQQRCVLCVCEHLNGYPWSCIGRGCSGRRERERESVFTRASLLQLCSALASNVDSIRKNYWDYVQRRVEQTYQAMSPSMAAV